MMNSLTHSGIMSERGGFMNVSYTLGMVLGKALKALKKMHFLPKLVLTYFLLSNFTLHIHALLRFLTDLVAYSAVGISFIVAGLCYYGVFCMFKGSLKWAGRQIRND